MKITYQEWIRDKYDFADDSSIAKEIALRMAKLADLGAEVVELEQRGKHYIDGYEITALIRKFFPKEEEEE
jgi:hypothetical protein